MYVYCVETFGHLEYYSDCTRRGSHLLNPFATVLFNVCNAWVCWVSLLFCKEDGSSPVY